MKCSHICLCCLNYLGDLDTLDSLIKNGADVNSRIISLDSDTILITAVRKGISTKNVSFEQFIELEYCLLLTGNEKMVEFLLNHGADPNIFNIFLKRSALDYATDLGTFETQQTNKNVDNFNEIYLIRS